MLADLVGERICVSVDWSPSMVADLKSISGASWSARRSAWTYPASEHTFDQLKDLFGDEFAATRALSEWATAQKRRRKALSALSGQRDAALAHIPVLAPVMAAAMASRTYQRAGARFGARAGSYCLADEPGLGKTLQVLGAMIEADEWTGQNLVIAPKSSLSRTWERQIRQWTPDAEAVAAPEGRVARDKAWADFLTRDEPSFFIVNPAMVRRKYDQWCPKCKRWKSLAVRSRVHTIEDHKTVRKVRLDPWPQIITHPWHNVFLDESHEVLSAYRPSNVSQTVAGLLDIKSVHRVGITGTPIRGHEENLWGMLDWLGVNTGGYWGYVEEFLETASNGFGKEIIGLDSAREEALYRMLDSVMLRRTRIEVRGDLPMGQRFDILVDMTPNQKRQYDEFASMGEAKLASGMLVGMGALAEIVRLRQLSYGSWDTSGGKLVPTADSPKLEWLLAWLARRGVTGKRGSWLPEAGSAYKYIVASQFTRVIDSIEAQLNALGIETMKMTGDVSKKRRDEYQEAFQSADDSRRVLLLNTQTGGSSLDLDAWCDEMVILDETFVADDQRQLEGRNDNRSGRVAPRSWWYVRTADSIEQAIAEGNWNQQDLQHAILDKRRGVEVALHLIGRRAR